MLQFPALSPLRFLAREHPSWNPDCDGVGWNVTENNSVGSNHHIISYLDRAKNLGAGAYIHAIANGRRSALAGIFQSHRNAIANDTIISKDRVTAYDDSTKVVNAKTPSKRDFTGKLDSGQYLAEGLD
jgi:hypothetical protein